jgi:hypothetical protein
LKAVRARHRVFPGAAPAPILAGATRLKETKDFLARPDAEGDMRIID